MMNAASGAYSKIKSRLTERKSRRARDDLIARIGELTYVQRIDPSVSHDADVARLVEEVRHLDRMQELRRTKEIADGE
jgi:hypothetical protein